MHMSDPNSPVKAFISYAEKDEDRKEKLRRHLRVLEGNKWLEMWWFRRIDAGGEWRKEIDEHVESADVFLLVITDHFVDSQYCWEKEMARALERRQNREAAVIPILFANYLWEDIQPLEGLTWIPDTHSPGKKAVESWPNENDALRNVAERVKKVVLDLPAHLAKI